MKEYLKLLSGFNPLTLFSFLLSFLFFLNFCGGQVPKNISNSEKSKM